MRRLIVAGASACLAVGLLALAGTSGAFAAAPRAEGGLAGRTIVLDPGHNLGNANPRFAQQMAQTMFNGTTTKGCNTTGTATNAGYPEATFAWNVAGHLATMLEDAGAKVVLTRHANDRDHWGPCVWTRAQIANDADADAMVSIHADGAPARDRGFFAIVPTLVKGYTEDVVGKDRRLARAMVAGMTAEGATPSNYVSGQILHSSNTTSLNLSNVPTTTIELGNMRNAAEARLMSTAKGQRQYAQWLYAGLVRYFS